MTLDHLEDDQFQKELIWTLHHATDLTQEEIANHQFVSRSQPTVSRIINEYDPALDGSEFAGRGYGKGDDVDPSNPPVTEYREALAEAIAKSPGFAQFIGMADYHVSEE